jgi:hypothetical protein
MSPRGWKGWPSGWRLCLHEDVTGRIDVEFADGGEQRLKNIDRPVRVYRLRTPTAQTEPGEKAEPNLRHIGFVGVTRRAWYDELRRGPVAYGHLDGQTIRIHYRWSEGDSSRFPDLVKELLDLPVELIVATGTPPVAAAKQMTSSIPIVFVEVGDPVGYGMVPSLARPGGNVTGLSNNLYEYAPRSLRLFKDIVPAASRVGILCPAHNTGADEWIKSMEAVSQVLDMVPRTYRANTADELRRVLSGIDPVPMSSPPSPITATCSIGR